MYVYLLWIETSLYLSNEDIKDGWAQECYEYSGNGEILKNLKDEKDGVYKNYLYFFQLNGFYK